MGRLDKTPDLGQTAPSSTLSHLLPPAFGSHLAPPPPSSSLSLSRALQACSDCSRAGLFLRSLPSEAGWEPAKLGPGSSGRARPAGSLSLSSGSQASRLGSPWRNHRLGLKQNAPWKNPLPGTPERYRLPARAQKPQWQALLNARPSSRAKEDALHSATSGHAYGPSRPTGLHFPEVSELSSWPKRISLSLCARFVTYTPLWSVLPREAPPVFAPGISYLSCFVHMSFSPPESHGGGT